MGVLFKFMVIDLKKQRDDRKAHLLLLPRDEFYGWTKGSAGFIVRKEDNERKGSMKKLLCFLGFHKTIEKWTGGIIFNALICRRCGKRIGAKIRK